MSGVQVIPSAERMTDPVQPIARLRVGSTTGRHTSPAGDSAAVAGSIRTVTGVTGSSVDVVGSGRLATIWSPSHDANTVDPSVVRARAARSPTRQT